MNKQNVVNNCALKIKKVCIALTNRMESAPFPTLHIEQPNSDNSTLLKCLQIPVKEECLKSFIEALSGFFFRTMYFKKAFFTLYKKKYFSLYFVRQKVSKQYTWCPFEFRVPSTNVEVNQ